MVKLSSETLDKRLHVIGEEARVKEESVEFGGSGGALGAASAFVGWDP
jgi:hypothetical protein